eukprot:Amastigsp_a841748_16.p3 type:complete len:115 gc:universal Amastigsp_a841748_16:513-857(+)
MYMSALSTLQLVDESSLGSPRSTSSQSTNRMSPKVLTSSATFSASLRETTNKSCAVSVLSLRVRSNWVRTAVRRSRNDAGVGTNTTSATWVLDSCGAINEYATRRAIAPPRSLL